MWMLSSSHEGTQVPPESTDSRISLATQPPCFSAIAHLNEQPSRTAVVIFEVDMYADYRA